MTGPVPRPIERIEGADALRGIAACAVVLHHLVTVGRLDPGPWLGPIQSHFGLGVPMFYVISAFAMYHVYFDAHREPGFAPRFMARRYARLLPLYLVLFPITALAFLAFGKPLRFEPWQLPIFATLTFGLVPSLAHGYVAAAWSLGVEMLFYAAFPLMVACIRTPVAALAGLALAMLVSHAFQAGIDAARPPTIYYTINAPLYLPCFFAGAAIWLLRERWRDLAAGQSWLLAGLSLAAIVLAYLYSPPFSVAGHAPLHYWWKVQGLTVAFSILLFATTTAPVAVLVNRVTVWLGRLSYGIYLLHTLVLLLLVKPVLLPLKAALPGQPTLVFLLAAVLTFAILLPLAEFAYRFVEAPGIRLGGRIAKWIDARHAAEAAAQWSETGPVARAKDAGRDKPVSQSSET